MVPAQLLVLLTLVSLQMAATDFSLVYSHPNGFQSTVASDVGVQLSMGSLNPTVCTGTAITPSASVSSNWYSSYYTSKLASNAPGYSYLVSYTSTQPQRQITWVDSGDYTSITNQQSGGVSGYFLTVGAFTSFMSGLSVSPVQSTLRSAYTDPFGGTFAGTCSSAPYCYKADTAFYCKGITNLVSSNAAYNRNVPDYLGSSSVSFGSIPLNTPGTYTFKPTFALGGCIASGRTWMQPAGGNPAPVENVHLYKNTAFVPVTIDNAVAQTVTVKNPFSCNAVVFSAPVFTPSGTVLPGAQTSFSFTVTNPSSNGEDARVNSVATSGWSPVPSPAPQPYNVNVPLTVPKNGVPLTISGNLDAPTTPGTYTFNLVVNFGSAVADCSGSTVSCSPKTFPVSFTVSPPTNPVSCTLAFDNHAAAFTPVDSAWVNATCNASNGAAVPCGNLSWTTTAASGSMSPPSTSSPPSPSRSQLTINAVNAPQTGANVKAQHANFSCTVLFNVAAPDYLSTITAPAQAQVSTNFTVYVETKNLGAASNTSSITRLLFNGAAKNFNIAPLAQGAVLNSANFTCPSAHGMYLINSTADATGAIAETSETNNFDSQWINCTIAPPTLLPDYVSSISAQASVPVGTSFAINVTTTNIGQAPSGNASKTRLLLTGCGGSTSFTFSVPALGMGGSALNTTSPPVNCPATPCTLVLGSSADYFSQVIESNETNNNGTFTVNCVLAQPTLLPNYVPGITAPSVAFIGFPFAASFITKNAGTANAANISTTRTSFESTVKTFQVAPLAVNAQQADSWAFTCLHLGTANLVQAVDNTSAIGESSEIDNVETKPIDCNTPPTSCNLSFVGHNSTVYASDSALVRATCFAGASQTACPPFLWQQTAVGGSMSPTNTNASMLPNSTLLTSGSVATQLGMKVTATSTSPSLDISCELPFNMSDGSPIGPDYIIPSITPDHASTALGQVVHFTVNVKNIGNVDAVNGSTSVAAFSSGCTPSATQYSLPPLKVSQVDINSDLACTCNSAGLQNITVTANPAPHAQWETNFNNNGGTHSFICQPPFQVITCSYFV